MRRVFAAGCLSVLALLIGATPGTALAQQCAAGLITQFDMAGTYISTERQIRVEIYPCGGSYVQWENSYGTHRAAYLTTERIPGGGVIARGYTPDAISGGYADGSSSIAFKPAEPGYIEVMTMRPYDDTLLTRHLRKIG